MKILRLQDSLLPDYAIFPFFKDGAPIQSGQKWGMTLKSCGNMRFRWNEDNPLRRKKLSEIAAIERDAAAPREIAGVELIHSKDVLLIENANDTWKKCADGIITKNSGIMPVVTVADCVPLYFLDPNSGAFGVVHSGWKGTGIAEKAITSMKERFSSRADELCVAIGAHIHECCYIVNQERADFFKRNFSADCTKPFKPDKKFSAAENSGLETNGQKNGKPNGRKYGRKEIPLKDNGFEKTNPALKINWNYGDGAAFHLSLLQANLFLLKKCGVKDKNIAILDECTCCNEKFGSNRRQTANGETPFTVQAAFVLC